MTQFSRKKVGKDLPVFKDLKDKTVFITGGASGIGAYFTAAFALQGANVGFVSLNDGPAEKLCASVEENTGRKPHNIICNINDIALLEKSIKDVSERFGPIDILINNAARDTRHTISDFTVEDWDNSIATNLRPQFFSIKAVVDDMAKTGRRQHHQPWVNFSKFRPRRLPRLCNSKSRDYRHD